MEIMGIEAMKMAIEALEDANDVARMEFSDEDYYSEVINALRQAIEQAEHVHAGNTSQKRVDETAKGEQEPVAWISDSPTNGRMLHWTRAEAWRWSSNITPLFTAPPPRKPLTEWQPIETAPKTGRKVILFYLNRNKLPRTVMARWLSDEQAAETDADDVGLEGGWYECIDNWDDYTEVAIHEGEPSHWMPLPAPPIEAAHGIGEKI